MTSIESEQNADCQKRHRLNHLLISAAGVNANEKYTPGLDVRRYESS